MSNENTQQTILLSQSEQLQLKELALNYNTSKSEIVRSAIRRLYRRMKNEQNNESNRTMNNESMKTGNHFMGVSEEQA